MLQQLPVPGVGRAAFPCALSDLAEAFGGDVEDRSFRGCCIAEAGAVDGAYVFAFTVENAGRVEDLHAELDLQLPERSEHPVDAAARLLAPLVRRDHQKAPLPHLGG